MSAHELGLRHLSPRALYGEGIADKFIFKFGLMRPTERINRYVSVLASIREQKELGRIIRIADPKSTKYKHAYNKLTDFYKLSDKEISLIKKYGTRPENINTAEFKDRYEAGKVKRDMQVISEKMSTLAHINTQGASIDIFMPAWAEHPAAKSALLYKRMAYAATVNTLRNMKVAYKTGSPLSFAMFGLGTYYGGETMIYVYNKLLGQTMPTENSPMGKQIATTLWKGEFMGLASEFLSPYFGRENMMFSAKPAIVSSAGLVYATISNIWKGDKFWLEGEPKYLGVGQQLKELTTGHIGLLNGVNKIVERGANPYYKQVTRFNKLHKEFTKEMNKEKDYKPNTSLFSQFEKSKYMNAFYKMFHAGSEKEFTKWYVLSLFSKAQDYYMEGRAPGIIPGEILPVRSRGEALKLAKVEIKRALDRMNPVKEIFDPKTGKISKIREINFYKWLVRDEYAALKKKNPKASEKALWEKALENSDAYQDLKKASNTYNFKRRNFRKNFKENIKDYNIEQLLSVFGITEIL